MAALAVKPLDFLELLAFASGQKLKMRIKIKAATKYFFIYFGFRTGIQYLISFNNTQNLELLFILINWKFYPSMKKWM